MAPCPDMDEIQLMLKMKMKVVWKCSCSYSRHRRLVTALWAGTEPVCEICLKKKKKKHCLNMGCVHLTNPPEAKFSKMDKGQFKYHNRALSQMPIHWNSTSISLGQWVSVHCLSTRHVQGTGVHKKATSSSPKEKDIGSKRSKKSTCTTGIHEIFRVGLEKGLCGWEY